MDRSLLARATEGTDAPTPGYLYLDIAKNAATSPMACQEIATYLTRRLSSKNNHNIKYKCLKVIAKTAESPVTRGQFKRAVCQDPTAVTCIKEALQFRGRPDPARGDEPYARVREAAKEALDAIYSDTPSSTSTEYSYSSAVAGGGGMQASYGASPYASAGHAHAASSGPGPRRMEGIGNPMYKDPRLEPQTNLTIGQAVSVAGETIVGMIKDPLAKNVPTGPPPRSNMPGYGSGGAYGNPPPGRSQLASATGGQWTMASNRGPDAVGSSHTDSDYYKARERGSQWNQHSATGGVTGGVAGGVGGSWATAPPPPPPAAAAAAPRPSVASQAREPAYAATATPSIAVTSNIGSGGTAASDGNYERNLILELCPPGGMKAEPPPDKLANFARAVPSLNPDLVCPALLDCLEDGQPWIIRAKALCVMETIVRVAEQQGPDAPTYAYVDFFHACSAEIEPLASHPRAAIKEPARRVLRALGVDVDESKTTAATPGSRRPPPPAAEPPNLLDFDEAEAAPASPPVAAPPKTPPAESLFGGLKVQSSQEATPVAPSNPDSDPPKGEHAESLLGESPAVPPTSTVDGGLFGDMNVKTDDKSTKESSDATAAAPPASASAFGFINTGSTSQTPAASKTVPPSKESFDPLLNLSPNTAKAMSSVPPAQMQALSYQMMMQQQQMQMQQMQMAYAMQQQQMAGRPMMVQMPRPGSGRNVMTVSAAHVAASNSFSFLDNKSSAAPKEDKKFDFIKEAMKNEGEKKK